MQWLVWVSLALALGLPLAPARAQERQITPQMCINLDNLTKMMTDINAALARQPHPEAQAQLLDLMTELARLTQEMCGPTGYTREQEHARSILNLQDRLREVKQGLPVKPGH